VAGSRTLSPSGESAFAEAPNVGIQESTGVEFVFEAAVDLRGRHRSTRSWSAAVDKTHPHFHDVTLLPDHSERLVGSSRPSVRCKNGRFRRSSRPCIHLFVDVERMTFQVYPAARAVPQEARRSIEVPTDVVESSTIDVVDDRPTRCEGNGSGSHGHLAQHSECSKRADEDASQVESGHVLDGRTSDTNDVTSMTDHQGLEKNVSHGATTKTVYVGPTSRQSATDRSIPADVDVLTCVA